MSLLDVFRRDSSLSAYAAAVDAGTVQASIDPSTYPLSSPWSSSNLQRIVFDDIFGSDIPSNTRTAAMRLATVARARNLLCTTIARLPLAQLRGAEETAEQPTWLYRSDDGASPQQRIVWTVDDLIFYGWSCWWRKNGADGFPTAVGRINQDAWTINADNRVEVNGQVVRDNEVILIGGIHEGILSFGCDVLDDARTLHRSVRARIVNPVPQMELHQTGGEELTDTEVDEMIADWAAARAGANGGVGFTNQFIELKEHGQGSDSQLMIEARNAAAVDLARIVGVTASRVDATADKASLNYETTNGRNQEFVDFDLALYMLPIAWRLSMDDVTPRGTRIDFDTEQFTTLTPDPTGPALED